MGLGSHGLFKFFLWVATPDEVHARVFPVSIFVFSRFHRTLPLCLHMECHQFGLVSAEGFRVACFLERLQCFQLHGRLGAHTLRSPFRKWTKGTRQWRRALCPP